VLPFVVPLETGDIAFVILGNAMRMLDLKAFRVPCTKFFLGITLGSMLASTAGAQDSSLKCMEGVYLLEEFKQDGEVFKPPQASGRWVILNGTVLWILYDRTKPSRLVTFAGVGHYTIDGTSYAYRYDEVEVYTQTDAGISVSRKPFWEGMRSYIPVPEADQVRLQHVESKSDFICAADGVTFRFGEGNYRKWRRISKE
jgi:hypothetical protein